MNLRRDCSVGACTRPHYGKGFCKLHWERWWKRGSTEQGPGRHKAAPCRVDGCDRTYKGTRKDGRGLCRLHYQRWWKTGDPLAMRGKRGRSWLDSFYARIDDSGGPDACHPWMGNKTSLGYGTVNTRGTREGKRTGAHRVLVEITDGVQIPDDLEVLHSCDNPPCCNRRHLRIGTHLDNMSEMVVRKRRRRKFSDETMTAVLYAHGTHANIAARFGMSASYVTTIKRYYRPGMHRSFHRSTAPTDSAAAER